MRLGLCLVLALAACSPAAPAEPPVAPPDDLSSDGAGPRPPPAGFVYHPPAVSPLADAAPLEDGRWLAVGQLGERWLSAPLPATAEQARGKTFDAQPSAYRAPHDLVSLTHLGDERGWMFLDAYGGVYTSLEPLGPLTVRGRATVALVSLAASAGTVLASDALGQVFRWHDDNWSPVATPAPLYALAGGTGILGLSFPETLYATSIGERWTPLSGETFGAIAVEPMRGGGVAVVGARSAERWADGKLSPMAKAPLTLPAPDVTLRAPRGPRASALGQQLAVLDDGHYVEMVEAEGSAHLLSGALGRVLKQTPLALEACDDQVLAASGKHVVVVCGVQSKGAIDVVVHRSVDGGVGFRRVAELRSVTPAFAHAAVAPDGSVLLTGMCRRGGSAKKSCEAGAPLRIAAASDGITQTHATDLLSDAQAPAWSPDGRRAYFYGKRGKDQQRALFVSSDGGKTFDARALSKPAGHRGRWMTSQASRYITVAADGALGLMLDDYPLTYAMADADGRAITLAVLPEATQALGGHGRNLLALTQRTEPDRPALAELWESNDGGTSFRQVSLPMELSMDEFTRLGVQCSAAGCIIGDRLTKVGWNAPIGPPAPARAGTTTLPELRTPIRCQVTGEDWKSVDHVVAVRESYHLPAGTELMRGKTLWAILRHDDRVGEVSVLSAELHGEDVRYKAHTLLEAVGPKRRSQYAYDVKVQIDGFAAARVQLPKGRRAGEAMRDVEVAWINYRLDEQGRGVIEDAGPFGSEDVSPGDKPSWLYGLLSMTSGGIVLRPSDDRADTFVLDGDGNVVTRADYPSWPPTRHEKVELDAIAVDGVILGVGDFHGQSTDRTLAFAALGQSDARFVSMAPMGADRLVEMVWEYLAGGAGMLVTLQDAEGRHTQSWFAPFRADGTMGARVAVPTQSDYGDVPPPCSDSQRRDTVRVPALPMEGTQHPVLIAGLGDDRPMKTQRLILHGSPASPCVAAFQAHAIGPGVDRAAVLSADASRGWVFEAPPEMAPTVGMAAGIVRYRPLSCGQAPEVRVDPKLYFPSHAP